MINGENFFEQPTKNNKVTYENIRKVATGQGHDYTASCLLDYPYFKDSYKMIAVDLSKQQALDADQYNSLNVKLSNSQLNKLKPAIKNETDVVLRLSSNMIGNSDDETNFSHKLLLTNRQVANLRKAFANYLSIDVKLSKTQLSKMMQSGGFLGGLLGPLLKTGLPLTKGVIKPLAKSVSVPLGLTTAASAADAGIHKKILVSGHNTTLLT